MKYSQLIGITAALLLIGSCFLPWAWYPDLQKEFTGFFSEGNTYGRPGKVFVVLGIVCIILFLIPRIWAKRINIIACAITFAFSLKCFLLYSACYKGICPEKRTGLFLMLLTPAIMIIAAVLPDIKLKQKVD